MLDAGDRVRYWPSRAKLAGMFTLFPATLLVIAFAIWIHIIADRHITPASVSVSGYFRHDGTYVNSYHRRPAGSIPHDVPYEFEATLASIVIFSGVCYAGFIFYRFLYAPVRDILPPVEIRGVLVNFILVPHKTAHARKSWACLRCSDTIVSGSPYWYYSTGQGSSTNRHRYCSSCYIELQWDYAEEIRKREEQCEKYFGPLKSRLLQAAPLEPIALSENVNLQSTIAPNVLPDLITIGLFNWEALLREAERWTPEMDDDLLLALPTFNDGELFRIWKKMVAHDLESAMTLSDINYSELWDALRKHIAARL